MQLYAGRHSPRCGAAKPAEVSSWKHVFLQAGGMLVFKYCRGKGKRDKVLKRSLR